MSKSKIEWTDRTWNPVTGCTKVSQGCKNCYAERLYERFHGHGSFKNILMHSNRLDQPLHWKKPSMVFVNSMSDLFHEDVPFEFVDMCFMIMAEASTHTFQILTKRPERLLEYSKNNLLEDLWPLPNVWLGVSVEDQKAADERIPVLIKIPAAVRFLSCEPLLGPINLSIRFSSCSTIEALHSHPCTSIDKPFISWVICGGESGPGARPMHPEWARSLRDQCQAAGVPFFFKQWGEWVSVSEVAGPGKHFSFSDGTTVRHTGKKLAGNLLDGLQHLEMPLTAKIKAL
jgi:protein gp37